MDKKEYLESYEKLWQQYQMLDTQIKGLKSIDYDHIKTTAPVTLVDKLAKIDDIGRKMKDIELSLDSIEDLTTRTILEYRYILFYSVEDTANVMDLCISTIKRRSKQGIEELIPI